MKDTWRRTSLRFIGSLAVAFLAGTFATSSVAQVTVFRGARVIDGTGRPPIQDALVVVEAGRVRQVGAADTIHPPRDARRVDLSGKTVMPLLVCLHGHLGQTINGISGASDAYTDENVRAQLMQYLRYGVGSVVALGTDQELIYTLRAGRIAGARVYTAGLGFGTRGGFPPGQSHPKDVYRPSTPEEARTEVRELAAHHPDFVKIWVDDGFGRYPKIKPEIYLAIIEEAHAHHLRVLAHVFYLDDAKSLVAAGVDGLAHSVRDRPVDQELIHAMKSRGVFLIPTLVRDESTFIYADGGEWLRDPLFQAGLAPGDLARVESPEFQKAFRADPDLARYRAALEMAKRNLKTLFDAGVKIGFGTDSGPPLRIQGFCEHRELELMVDSGLTPMQAIRIATGQSAEILHADDLGTLEPGKQADFMVLDSNPVLDVGNNEKLNAVWQRGEPIKPITAH